MFHECRPCANVTQALHLIAIRARVSTTLDQILSRIQIPCTSDENPHVQTSRQLGRGVHNFGHKSPYTNIAHQLGWGVYYYEETQCTNMPWVPTTLGKNPIEKHIIYIRQDELSTNGPKYKNIVQVKNANT